MNNVVDERAVYPLAVAKGSRVNVVGEFVWVRFVLVESELRGNMRTPGIV